MGVLNFDALTDLDIEQYADEFRAAEERVRALHKKHWNRVWVYLMWLGGLVVAATLLGKDDEWSVLVFSCAGLFCLVDWINLIAAINTTELARDIALTRLELVRTRRDIQSIGFRVAEWGRRS